MAVVLALGELAFRDQAERADEQRLAAAVGAAAHERRRVVLVDLVGPLGRRRLDAEILGERRAPRGGVIRTHRGLSDRSA